MSSLYLARQKPEDRFGLINKLHSAQKGHCFICEEAIDLAVHKNSIDIDHVVPLTVGGKDDPSNFALTHASCNRSKQASNLEVARILYRFTRLRKKLEEENRSPNLGDLLSDSQGGNHKLNFKLDAKTVTYSFGELGDNALYTAPVYEDELSGFHWHGLWGIACFENRLPEAIAAVRPIAFAQAARRREARRSREPAGRRLSSRIHLFDPGFLTSHWVQPFNDTGFPSRERASASAALDGLV